jgi:hemerythrin
MPRIEWNPAFSVNQDEIDIQHQKWFQLYNELRHDIIRYETDTQDSFVPDSLKAMEAYSKMHFAFEENYMEKIGFPGLDEHKRLHQEFQNKIVSFRQKQPFEAAISNRQILEFIKIWLLEHVLNADIQYRRYRERRQQG